MNISITELGRFLRCRRQWWISSPNGMSLKKKGAPQQKFYIGTAFHKACELNALHPKEDIYELTYDWLNKEADKIAAKYHEQVGTPLSDQEKDLLLESRSMVLGMVQRYFAKYGTDNPIAPFKYVAPEVSFKIPLLSDRPVYLVGTIDGVGIDEFGALGVVEHKTFSPGRAKKEVDYEMDAQTMGYQYALWRLTGVMPSWSMYDGVAKAIPVAPRVLRNGKLSVDKSTPTTYALYLQAILDNDEDPDGPRFADILEKLAFQDSAAGADPFFTRYYVSTKRKALETFEQNLLSQARDMWVARDDSEKRYPHRPWTGCSDCDFRDVCDAIQYQEDVDKVAEASYTIGTYGTAEALKDLTPQTVTDVESLKAAIANKRGASV